MKSSTSLTLTFLAFIFVLVLWRENAEAAVKIPNGEKIPAVIVFGDSIVDPGNNNHLLTISKCDFQPYGQDFMGGKPTGRFTNGKIPTDIIAEELGIKTLIPAYLDPALRIEDLPTGVSFASGGSGYDPLTPVTASALSLPQQLNLFKEYISKLRKFAGEEKTKDILTRSLFLVVSGSNDIANTYTAVRNLEFDVPSYTDLMLNYASSFIQELYELGARRIGILGAPPIGCVPMRRTLSGGIARECVESDNEAALFYNAKLANRLQDLNRRLPHGHIVFIDIYPALLGIIQNPQNFGFEVVDRGCCGTGAVEVSILCNKLANQTVCKNVSQYVFWDSYHPTEKTYILLFSQILPKYLVKFFD